MAEYIDKDIAIQICIDSWDTGDASQDIKDEPSADVIEREKVNKSIEEIWNLRQQYPNEDYYDCKYEVLEILRKNIGE